MFYVFIFVKVLSCREVHLVSTEWVKSLFFLSWLIWSINNSVSDTKENQAVRNALAQFDWLL